MKCFDKIGRPKITRTEARNALRQCEADLRRMEKAGDVHSPDYVMLRAFVDSEREALKEKR